MGNTKYIWYEGWIDPKDKDQFSESAIADACHSSLATSTFDPDEYQGEVHIIGMVYTHSSIGLDLLDHLEKFLTSGTFGYWDQDWPEMKLFRTQKGKKEVLEKRP